MAPLVGFLAFFVVLAALSLLGLGADSRTYPRWRGTDAGKYVRPRAE